MPETKVQENTTPITKKNSKSKVLLFVIIGIVAFIAVILIAGFFVVKGIFKKGVEKLEEGQELIEQTTEYEVEETEDGDTWTYKASTEEGVDGELEKENLLTNRFPKDIPLSGGVVTKSSYDDLSISATLDIYSTVEEILDWYTEQLELEGWEITSRSSEEMVEGWITGSIAFAKTEEERRGTISIDTNPFLKVSTVTIKELLY